MRIRMITFHTPKNYGAVLQAFSLMSYLKTLSDDVKVIDFNTPHLRAKYPLMIKPHSVKQAIRFVIELKWRGAKKRKFKKFDDFVKTNLVLTERYESFEELSSNPPLADYYFTGSDQVFNPNRVFDEQNAFYLNFGGKSVKRISYAGSFGVKAVDEEKKETIADFLNNIDCISVREKSGVEIVNSLTECEVVEVLDPVFLNGQEFWSKHAKPYKAELDKYLFYYRLMGSTKSDDAARRIAKEKGLKLVVMTDGFLKWKAHKVLRDVGPEEFLFLMENAEYIVTDSFHGVAFALIFKKQFAFTDFNPVLADRTLNLLERVGLSQAASINGNCSNNVFDYRKICDSLQVKILQSKGFIEQAL